MKKLILVHGRATKPQLAEKKRLITEAMLHGLKRVDVTAAAKVESGAVDVVFAYYGDINNELMVASDDDLKDDMELNPVDNIWYERNGSYDAALQTLFRRETSNFTKKAYSQLLKENDDVRYLDNLARFVSPLLANGLSKRIITRYLPDLGAYITSRKVGSRIRQRLQAPMQGALVTGDDVALVTHSMGCIAAYDVLWKFSHMSEYEHLHKKKISLWLTLGSPLGEPSVRESLYDAQEPMDGLYPRNVKRWVNISAHDDFVAHDGTVADDFKEMKNYECQITDLPRIYNFWSTEKGCNPHKLYGYLDHPVVAQQISTWILA